MTKSQKKNLVRIVVSAVFFFAFIAVEHFGNLGDNWILWLCLYAVPYLIVGYDIFGKAFKNIRGGQVFDENFLMVVATVAAFGIHEFSEAVAVMLFYQVGELFQGYAVGKSRKSISAMMDICPEYANVERDGSLVQVDPDEVEIGDIIVVKPGERIPLDGVVVEGESLVDTAALTGESVPRRVSVGSDIISGCVNGSSTFKVKVAKAFEDSTVSRILELVENASSKKARVENFITRFARVYTPIVTAAAVLLAIVPPLLFGEQWATWIERACIFLVVSCPCALVISVPLGFFAGIGAASKLGVLVKGSNYLEVVSKVKTVVFDKTGTLTKGEFKVVEILPAEQASGNGSRIDADKLLEIAALGESCSNHPIAQSVLEAYANTHAGAAPELSRVGASEEIPGRGIRIPIDGKPTLLGNERLMLGEKIEFTPQVSAGTVIYVAQEGVFLGTIVISDTVKEGCAEAIGGLKLAGVEKCVMLTGDHRRSAEAVAGELGIDEFHAELLPADKVQRVETLLGARREGDMLAFVGDGINDAPVLSRVDVGIAMGSLGSDAAIEAADVVIMDDDIRKIPATVRLARKTMRIVRQNIVFALSVKAVILVLGAVGIANMWMAVFGDVGVSVIAILNSMRMLGFKAK